MRLLLALFLVLLAAAPAQSAIAPVQTVSCQTGGSSACTTPSTTTTNGNLFIANLSYCCNSVSSITDSKGNSYSFSVADFTGGAARGQQRYIAAGVGGGSHTFTVTGSGGGFYAALVAQEVSGYAASPLDQTKTGTSGSGTSHTSTSTATTSQANELLIGFGGSDISTTYTTDTGAGWTERTNLPTTGTDEGILVGTRIVSATGTYAYTFTSGSSVEMMAAITTWKEAAAATGTRQRCVGCGADGKVIE